MSEIDKENVIKSILEISYEDWTNGTQDDSSIKKHYKYLREKVFDIFSDYDNKKEIYTKKKCTLQEKRIEFNQVSKALFLLNRVLLFKSDISADKEFNRYFFATNTFINKLQSQYISDVDYHIQQIDGKCARLLAYVAIGITVFFSVLNFVWNCKKSDSFDRTEPQNGITKGYVCFREKPNPCFDK